MLRGQQNPASDQMPLGGDAPHIMIVEARYYDAICDELLRGAVAAIEAAGATYERFAVPGAFEIPAAIQYSIRSHDYFSGRKRFDGYVALGCVIRGETSHYDYVCGESARGLQDLAIQHTLALGYGILTVENEDQAWARAKLDKGNKGGEAAKACLAMLELKRRFRLFPR
jgi:6,7-dimethyl-8-ribityllumazine synthase